MSTSVVGAFNCGSCGKQFKWKPEIAGRKAKCACGTPVQVPDTEPGKAGGGSGGEDGFAFDVLDAAVAAPPPVRARPVEVAPAPKRGGGAKAAGAGAAAAAVPAKKMHPLAYASKKSVKDDPLKPRNDDDNYAFWGPVQERVAPMIVMGVSAAVIIAITTREYGTAAAMAITSIATGITVVMLTVAAFFTASVAGISFGVMGLAIIRFAAVSTALIAVGEVFNMLNIPYSFYLEFFVNFAVFYGFMVWFFELEYMEVVILAMVITAMKWVLTFVLFAMLLSGMLAGPGKKSGGDGLLGDDEDATAVDQVRKPSRPGRDSPVVSPDEKEAAEEKDAAAADEKPAEEAAPEPQVPRRRR